MKKIILILAVLLFAGLSKAQRLQPISGEYNENGFTVKQFEKFLMKSEVLAQNYRVKFFKKINNGLANAGESLRLNENNIYWMFDTMHWISIESVTLSNFVNSGKDHDTVKFYNDQDFTGSVFVFKYRKCKLILAKTVCMNLLDVPVTILQTSPAPVSNNNTNAQSSPAITVTNSNYQQPQQQAVSSQGYYTALSGAYVNNHTDEDPYFDANDDGTPVLNWQRFMHHVSNHPRPVNGFGFGFTVEGFRIIATYSDGSYDYFNRNLNCNMHHPYQGGSGVGTQSLKPKYSMNVHENYGSNGGVSNQSSGNMNWQNGVNGGTYSGDNGNGYSGNGGSYSSGSGTE